nr:MAG TPA: hypothetical protein [Bacteriophage sp.]
MGSTQCHAAFYAARGALSARDCPHCCAGYARMPPQLFARPVAFCAPLGRTDSDQISRQAFAPGLKILARLPAREP